MAERYLAKNQDIENKRDFLYGAIAPDLVPDKHVTHYTAEGRNEADLVNYLQLKVQLNLFLANEKVDSDFQKGAFLHLVTDYLFFNKFFDREFLTQIHYADFWRSLYYSYEQVNAHVEEKFHVEYGDFRQEITDNISKKAATIDEGPVSNILPIEKLDEFIEYVSDINLEDYQRKILAAQRNILP